MGIPDTYVYWGSGTVVFLCIAYTIWDKWPNFMCRWRRRRRTKAMIQDYIDNSPGWRQ